MNVLEKRKESQGRYSYLQSVDPNFLLNRAGFADQNSATLSHYQVAKPTPEATPDLPAFRRIFESQVEHRRNRTLRVIYYLYAHIDLDQTCNAANIAPSFAKSIASTPNTDANVSWQKSPQPEAHRKARGAPDWLLKRMEAVRQMPPPTLEELRAQWAASAEARRKFSGKENA